MLKFKDLVDVRGGIYDARLRNTRNGHNPGCGDRYVQPPKTTHGIFLTLQKLRR